MFNEFIEVIKSLTGRLSVQQSEILTKQKMVDLIEDENALGLI